MTSSRPSWTISEAADRCGVSKSTVRRYREAGKFPSAFKDSQGAWKVPLEDLLAVGWKPIDPALNQATEQPADGLAERVRELEQALAVERARNEGLERVAAMAEASVADLRQAMKMIEASVSEQPEPPSEQVQDTPTEQPVMVGAEQPSERAEQPVSNPEPRRKRWWQL